jgi:lipid II:glycine glycyltransferase (peptidoglycan interpeptide bridge formation enzyme)
MPEVTMKAKPMPLCNEYAAEFDTVGQDQWHEILDEFSDANLYQTWSYDSIRCGENNISHLILRSAGKVVAAAQARVERIPFLGVGAAYVRWGPLWQLRNRTHDHAVFRLAIRSLKNEYVIRRGLVLRIFPLLYEDGSNPFFNILIEEGYAPVPDKSRGRTLILDIQPPMAELRKNLDQKWRNCLNKAERNGLEVIESTDDGIFADFIDIYHDLLKRKRFPEPNDIQEFREIQRVLPEKYRMQIILCRAKGATTAGGIFSTLGETGLYLFGATNDLGMENKSSYFVQWKAIERMKNCGCLTYNLNGINPALNPGTYHFKVGLSGKKGKDLYYVGRFDCYPGALEARLVRTADLALPFIKRALSALRMYRRPKPKSL